MICQLCVILEWTKIQEKEFRYIIKCSLPSSLCTSTRTGTQCTLHAGSNLLSLVVFVMICVRVSHLLRNSLYCRQKNTAFLVNYQLFMCRRSSRCLLSFRKATLNSDTIHRVCMYVCVCPLLLVERQIYSCKVYCATLRGLHIIPTPLRNQQPTLFPITNNPHTHAP